MFPRETAPAFASVHPANEYSMGKPWKFDFMSIFSLFMVLVYLGMGIFIMVTHTFDYVPLNFRLIFGTVMILYGIFRFVRVYYKIKNPER